MAFRITPIRAAVALLLFILLIGGCIVSDELTTITIHPDGSADLVKMESNVHSSETGTKAEEELRNYVEQFNAQQDVDQQQITQAGGLVLESRWIRADGRGDERDLSARDVGRGAAHRPRAGHECRGAGADLVRRVPARAAAAGPGRAGLRHPLGLRCRPAAGRTEPRGGWRIAQSLTREVSNRRFAHARVRHYSGVIGSLDRRPR